MAAGYDLSHGDFRTDNVSEDELREALTYFFSSESKNASSYKYAFLKAILDNLYNVDDHLVLTFEQIFSKFCEIYWNLILKYRLKQSPGRATKIEQILIDAQFKYSIPAEMPYVSLPSNIMDELTQQTKKHCSRYVLGAFFEDTKRLFYSFSKKEEWIRINPIMYEFVCKYKLSIEKANYYKWACYLEKNNSADDVVLMLRKIEQNSMRNDLSIFQHILYDEFEFNKCFNYAKNTLPHNNGIECIIPESFIKDENL